MNYKKTRYQNILKGNGNYVIRFHDSFVSKDNEGNKIFSIDDAIKVRDNCKKTSNTYFKAKLDTFSALWYKYIYWCENVDKQAYNNLKKKRSFFGNMQELYNLKIKQINETTISEFLKYLNVSDKQKNEYLKSLGSFFNWCIDKNIIEVSPTRRIKPYKVNKVEMKYWVEEDITKMLNYLNSLDTLQSHIVKLLILIEISTGVRTGELRALTFGDIEHNIIHIRHSINYDPKSNDFRSATKTYASMRDIDISDKLYNAILDYKKVLTDYGIVIDDSTPLFIQLKSNKPYSDTYLRKIFYYYIDKADVKKIRLYDLRHTYTTLKITDGFELYQISRSLGHTNIQTTMNKYGHIENKLRKEIATSSDKYY